MSAVVLSIGEPTVSRALASVYTQRPSLRETVVVHGVVPFSSAVNLGAANVRSPYFVQVDADMVLDPDCVARLRLELAEDVGIVVGQLRDALMGQVRGVKLFRTACFREVSMPDSVCQDTDFGAEIGRLGWRTVRIVDPADETGVRQPSFGEHRPAYTPLYTFQKYRVEGRRHRHRRRHGGLRWHFEILEGSRHPCALIAQVALAHGLFLRADEDLLRPYGADPEFDRLEAFLAGGGRAPTSGRPHADGAPEEPATIFQAYHELGRSLWEARASSEFRRLMRTIRAGARDEAARIAKIALCHGVFSDRPDEARLSEDFLLLEGLVRLTPVEEDGAW